MSPKPQIAQSLCNPNGATPASRRAYADVKAAIADPVTDAAAKTFKTRGLRTLHVVWELPDATTSLDLEVWTKDEVSGKWRKDTRPGTAGVVGLTTGTDIILLDIPGLSEVALKTSNLSGTFTNGANFWLATAAPDGTTN